MPLAAQSARPAPSRLDSLILQAQKPSRYAGGELNAIRKDWSQVDLKWALAFPDTYEVGMSNVGFRLLYHALNDRPDALCERLFMPWSDLEAALKREQLPLFSIESRAPLSAFDIVGFTLQFELCYTTVLAMLDLGGVPLLTKDRRRDDPLILGGGPCAYNPEPVADFFDCFVVGEGEEVIHEISSAVRGWKSGRGSREELLWQLAEIPGVYVPSLFEIRYGPDKTISAIVPKKPGYETVVRRVVPDLNLVPQAEKPIVPFMQTVHDRLPLEIQRGCTRGCRFCQVGMITRPTRQRDPNQVREIAKRGLASTGYEEVGFLSLSAGDYSCINGVLEDFFEEFGPENVGISLPSLRTETMTPRLAEQIGRVRKSGFTVAPEAATERMRRVINKGNAEKDLLHAVDTIFEAGWDVVKFYFMIGLPTERDEDVRAIVNLCAEALRRGRKKNQRASINVGVSTFCPKPFTPFQWDAMIPLEETNRKHGILKDEVRKLGRSFKDLHVKPHDARQGALEGALALGDRRLATAVLHAYKAGQRLDGWTENFQLDVWQEAFRACEREHGVGLAFFAHREKGQHEILPFDHIDCEVQKPYLWDERMESLKEGATDDCAYGNEHCTACGACDYEVVDTIVFKSADYAPQAPRPKVELPKERTTLRIRYAKDGAAIALSHLETMTAILRAFRRAKLQIPHTQGFNPKPKVGFGPACPVGTESEAEYLDLELFGTPDPAHVARHISAELPLGFRLLACEPVPASAPSVSASIRGLRLRLELPEGAPSLAGPLETLAQTPRALVMREREGKAPTPIDLKTAVSELVLEGERTLRFLLRTGEGEATARPAELITHLVGAEWAAPGVTRIVREGVVFAQA
ncbi:MAG: TIGR03960 family B12-binding radical SAM protein [Deltaproteobacteria bacterium]|nr:TIGR03960 family B12-binding radical SAM protein [Deltaproteobacteria bacterium]